ncbi:MAG: AI-2E family transporter [Dehalococcoidales bacterium]|nr:AI-2E family transporter [Dehalococcoidales bacterium]
MTDSQMRMRGWVLALAIIAVGVFLYLIRGILAPFVVAIALAYILSPIGHWLEWRLRLPRVAAVVLLYVLVFGPLAALFAIFGPTLVRDTTLFVANLPFILANLLRQLLGGEEVVVFGQQLQASLLAQTLVRAVRDFLGTPQEAARVARGVIEFGFNAFLSLVLLFYLLIDRERITKWALNLVPAPARSRAEYILWQVNLVLGRYLRGILFLISFMSIATWLGLFLLFRLPYAVPIAVATGFLEIVPFAGPVAAGTIAGIVALTHGGLGLLVSVVLFYVILRQVEDQVVSPNVLGRAVELHPVGIIFAVLAGGALAGILGVLLAVPVAAAVKVGLENWHADET